MTAAVVALAAAAAMASPAAGASTSTGVSAPRAVATAPASSQPPVPGPGTEPVASAGLQRRTILYKPGAAPAGAPTVTQAPSRSSARAGALKPALDATTCSAGPAAQVCVYYSGFNSAFGDQASSAMAAYQAAANIWANVLSSPVTITIDADVEAQGSGILASTGPNNFLELTSGGPWYPSALADAITRRNNNPASVHDIVSSVGSPGDTDWYLGTDGATPAGTYDLESVALHEIAHGLGFFSLTDANDPGLGCPQGQGCIGDPQAYFSNLPSIYDTWLVANVSATSSYVGWLTAGPGRAAGNWGNYSASLLGALTGWNPSGGSVSRVSWAGPQGIAAAGGTPPKIYSPNPWLPGSSISHLDSNTYAWQSPNGLLIPFVKSGQANHWPGPILLGMLRDIGWVETVAPTITAATPLGPTAAPFTTGSAALTWTPARTGIDGTSPVTGYQVQSGRFDGNGTVTTTQVGPSATSTTVTGLSVGVPYWVSVTAMSAASGPVPASAAGVLPQDLGSYADLPTLLSALVPRFLGAPNSAVNANLLAQMSYPGTLTTVQALVALNAFTLDPALGPLTRLYLAYFKRLPDPGGTSYWLGQLRAGVPLASVSNAFAASPEFVATYGSLDNPHFVAQVYQNVLGRQADLGGFFYWTNQLNQGMSRGQLMVFFSESPENVGARVATVQAVEGWWGMRQQVPTTSQVTAVQGRTAAELFGGLLDNTIS